MRPEIERRKLNLDDAELRVMTRPDGKTVIRGYASRFGVLSEDLGGFKEQIDPKAFDAALKTADVRALVNHDPNHVIGRMSSGTLKLEIDERGLHYEVEPPNSAMGAHWIETINRRDITGSSFSFTVEVGGGAEWDHSTSPPTRHVRAVRDLFDVGPVTYPAYLDADVAVASRSLEASRPPDPRVLLTRQRLRALSVFHPFLKG